jgi:hypothetical protein
MRPYVKGEYLLTSTIRLRKHIYLQKQITLSQTQRPSWCLLPIEKRYTTNTLLIPTHYNFLELRPFIYLLIFLFIFRFLFFIFCSLSVRIELLCSVSWQNVIYSAPRCSRNLKQRSYCSLSVRMLSCAWVISVWTTRKLRMSRSFLINIFRLFCNCPVISTNFISGTNQFSFLLLTPSCSRKQIDGNILWHIVPLLSNDREISKYTTAVSNWRLRKQTYLHENNWSQQQTNGVFCAVRDEVL